MPLPLLRRRFMVEQSATDPYRGVGMAEAGFLLTYGADTTEILRLGANQVDRILKRVKPGDLPIAQSTNFELVVNARIAKALAVDVPGSIMLRATKVIR